MLDITKWKNELRSVEAELKECKKKGRSTGQVGFMPGSLLRLKAYATALYCIRREAKGKTHFPKGAVFTGYYYGGPGLKGTTRAWYGYQIPEQEILDQCSDLKMRLAKDELQTAACS